MNCANHPDRERVAFCQNCGKPLCMECSRVVGQAVFCEPCLAARLAGAPGGAFAGTGSATGAGGAPNYGVPTPRPAYDGTIPPPSAPGEPNPGLAALLGFIPGVGAFYNGQYAKGVVHLIVFAVLISLADEHGIFGLFIAGWVFYQVIEAHHTARARRDGTPLPNPFGLNDLSERLGFGKTWPSAPPTSAGGYAPPAWSESAPSAADAPPPPVSTFSGAAAGSHWGAPETTYAASAGQTSAATAPPYAYVPEAGPAYAQPVSTGRTLPIGAFVLIGLGVFFLVANTGHFRGIRIEWFVPVLLIGAGVWSFFRRMTGGGLSLSDDGTPMYRFRLYTALRGAIWPMLVGVLFFLDLTHLLPWSRSWPLFIVVAGALALLQRTLYSQMPPMSYPGGPTTGSPVPQAGPNAAIVSTERVQAGSDDPSSNRS